MWIGMSWTNKIKTVNRYSHTVATERIKVIAYFCFANSMFDDVFFFVLNFTGLWINFFHACTQLRFKKWWLSINFYGVKHCTWQHAIFYKKQQQQHQQQQKMYESSNYKCGLIPNNTQFYWSLDSCFGFYFRFLYSRGLEGSERNKIGEKKKIN